MFLAQAPKLSIEEKELWGVLRKVQQASISTVCAHMSLVLPKAGTQMPPDRCSQLQIEDPWAAFCPLRCPQSGSSTVQERIRWAHCLLHIFMPLGAGQRNHSEMPTWREWETHSLPVLVSCCVLCPGSGCGSYMKIHFLIRCSPHSYLYLRESCLCSSWVLGSIFSLEALNLF